MTLETIGSGGHQQTTQNRTVYDFALLDPIDDWLVLLGFATPKEINAAAGQSGSLRALSRLAVKSNPLTEGTVPTPSAITMTEVTWTVGQYGDFVEYSDWFDLTAPDPVVVGIVMEQSRQAALSLDSAAQAVYLVGGTNVSYVNGRTARNQINPGEVVNASLLDDVIQLMQSRGVPYITSWTAPMSQNDGGDIKTVAIDAAYVAIVTPIVARRLKYIPGFDKASNYGSATTLLPYEVGKYDGLRFVQSTVGFRSATGGAGSSPVAVCLAFGEGALGRSYITGNELQPRLRPTGNASKGDELGQTGSVGWIATGAWFILNQSKMQRFEAAEV